MAQHSIEIIPKPNRSHEGQQDLLNESKPGKSKVLMHNKINLSKKTPNLGNPLGDGARKRGPNNWNERREYFEIFLKNFEYLKFLNILDCGNIGPWKTSKTN